MKITKTTKKTYNIEFCPNAIDWTFGSFKEQRLKNNMNVSKFEKCFICKHKFNDDEKVIIVSIDNGIGNRFACRWCLKRGNEVKNGD